jgi:hypothetical protein
MPAALARFPCPRSPVILTGAPIHPPHPLLIFPSNCPPFLIPIPLPKLRALRALAVHLSSPRSPAIHPFAPPIGHFGGRTCRFGTRSLRTAAHTRHPGPHNDPFDPRNGHFDPRTAPFGLRTARFDPRTAPFGPRSRHLGLRSRFSDPGPSLPKTNT